MKKFLPLIIILASATAFAAEAEKSKIKSFGMTWGIIQSKNIKGYVNVGCGGLPGSRCDAYSGDTSCEQELPILRINKINKIDQPEKLQTDTYNQWTSGTVKLTKKTRGANLTSLQTASQICEKDLGKNWRMAEFHDGWGWGFWAKGKIKTDNRFWVYINDQDANCWKQEQSSESNVNAGDDSGMSDEDAEILENIPNACVGMLVFDDGTTQIDFFEAASWRM